MNCEVIIPTSHIDLAAGVECGQKAVQKCADCGFEVCASHGKDYADCPKCHDNFCSECIEGHRCEVTAC